MSEENSLSDKQRPDDYPGALASWLAFCRPKTWGVAAAPVCASLALCYSEQHVFDPVIAFFTLTIAILMQAISNMENDLGYTERKAEVGNRRGLPRATTRGWISVPAARAAIRCAIALATINTVVLIYFGGWGFALVGVASAAAAYFYMGGPKPIAYTPFSELLVLIFFGFTAVCGTFYLQAGFISFNAALLGAALGCMAAAVLAVNNFRDREHDASIGRRTLAVLLPEKATLRLFETLITLPYFLIAAMVVRDMSYWPYFLVMASFPDCMKLPDQLRRLHHEELNAVMFGCVKLEVKFSMLFTIGALIQALLVLLTVQQLL